MNKTCQFISKPMDVHWCAVKRILRYIQVKIHHGIVFKLSTMLVFIGFADADWGYAVMIEDLPIVFSFFWMLTLCFGALRNKVL